MRKSAARRWAQGAAVSGAAVVLGLAALAPASGGTSGGASTGADSVGVSTRDVSGPCDELEHLDDPRCAGGAARIDDTPTPDDTAAPGVGASGADVAAAPQPAPTAGTGGDVSGPCDEAEHADDPRCTGSTAGSVSDGSGATPAPVGTASGVRGSSSDDGGRGRGRGRGRGGDDSSDDSSDDRGGSRDRGRGSDDPPGDDRGGDRDRGRGSDD